MTPEQAAHDTRAAVALGGAFMVDGATYARGAELGFEGLDFYVAGRGSALGDVTAEVVTAAFVFFAPATVAEAWARSAAVADRATTAAEFAACCHAWGRARLPETATTARAAELLGPVVAGASVAAAPLFAGWRALPEPADPRALLAHRLNALRELRGALHAAAILTVGLAPVEAVSVGSPAMFGIFGHEGPPADPEPLRDRWNLAEARTDRMTGRAYGVLAAEERAELVEVLAEAVAGT